MPGSLFDRGLDAAQIGQRCRVLIKQIVNCRDPGHLPHPLGQTLGNVPFLADDDKQCALAPKAGFGLPEAGGKAAPDPAPPCQKTEQATALVRNGKAAPDLCVKLAQFLLQLDRVGRDLARKEIVLCQQQVVVVVIEGHRHAVVGEHQERQGPGADLDLRHQMPHKGLEEGLVRDPCRAEEPQHIWAPIAEGNH